MHQRTWSNLGDARHESVKQDTRNNVINIFAVIIDFGNIQGSVNFLICKCSECFQIL